MGWEMEKPKFWPSLASVPIKGGAAGGGGRGAAATLAPRTEGRKGAKAAFVGAHDCDLKIDQISPLVGFKFALATI